MKLFGETFFSSKGPFIDDVRKRMINLSTHFLLVQYCPNLGYPPPPPPLPIMDSRGPNFNQTTHPPCTFYFVEIFHVIKIQSAYC